MDCDELIDEMLSCSRGTAEKQRYEGTAGVCGMGYLLTEKH